jgi:tetratricopeptide (TPR) repeat protein
LLQQLKEFQRNPRSLVFVALAESYRQEGLTHQALEILEEGLAYHPGLASAILCKARCLFALRRYAEALAETKSAVMVNPQNLKAHKLQAEIYVRLGQRRAAIRALTQVVSLYPQDVEAVRALEELESLESGSFVPVREVSRASVDSAPAGRIEDFRVGPVSEQLAQLIGDDAQAVALSGSVASDFAAEEDEKEAGPGPLPADEEDSVEPTFATRTIAELYLRQGLRAKAAKVLRKILREDAANQWARETLQDLESDGILLPARTSPKPNPSSSRQKRARALERMLARVRVMKRLGA